MECSITHAQDCKLFCSFELLIGMPDMHRPMNDRYTQLLHPLFLPYSDCDAKLQILVARVQAVSKEFHRIGYSLFYHLIP